MTATDAEQLTRWDMKGPLTLLDAAGRLTLQRQLWEREGEARYRELQASIKKGERWVDEAVRDGVEEADVAHGRQRLAELRDEFDELRRGKLTPLLAVELAMEAAKGALGWEPRPEGGVLRIIVPGVVDVQVALDGPPEEPPF